MNRQQKSEAIDELKQAFDGVSSMVLADFRGIKVGEVTGVRAEMRKADCVYKVVKNTLAQRAVAGTVLEPLSSYFEGPTAVVYSREDPVAPAKLLDKFAEDLKSLKIKVGFVDGTVLDPAGVRQLAKMKGKDELRAELLMTLKAGPQSFVALLAAAPQNFLYLLQARKRGLEEG